MPYNPLALQRYRTRRDELRARVAAGEISAMQAAAQLLEFREELFRRRGDPQQVKPSR